MEIAAILGGVTGKILVSIATALIVVLLFPILHPLAFFQHPNRSMRGEWHRYGVGFYSGVEGQRPVHRAKVRIIVLPGIAFAWSSNVSYSYFGRIAYVDNNIYIYWIGFRHRERMMSVYAKPLIVNKRTRLIGTKACITRDGKPAMNLEILSKSEMCDSEIRSEVGRDRDSRHVREPLLVAAHYE